MVIQHNMEAYFNNRQFNMVNKRKAKNAEKLSSGYQINRAADDAAGLTISEKMRWQIRGLNQAARNAEDGQSLIQVADGALEEVHAVLQRMNELATQAANDANTNDDRRALGKEIDQLQQEIDRISRDTMFNTFPVLRTPTLVDIDAADYGNAKLDTPTQIAGINYPKSKSIDFTKIGASDVNQLAGRKFQVHCSQGCQQEFLFNFVKDQPSGVTVGGSADRPDIQVTININDVTSGTEVAQKIYNLAASQNSVIENADPSATNPLPPGATYIGHDNGMVVDGGKLTFFALDSAGSGYIEASDLGASDLNFHLQVGALKEQSIDIGLRTINSATLGVNGMDVSNYQRAGSTMRRVQKAINSVSEYRSYLGAKSNRLEHTIDNLNNTSENTQWAESRLRDTDMAKTMVEYSKDNILAQVGQAMLSQANQKNQGVLSLLQ